MDLKSSCKNDFSKLLKYLDANMFEIFLKFVKKS